MSRSYLAGAAADQLRRGRGVWVHSFIFILNMGTLNTNIKWKVISNQDIIIYSMQFEWINIK